MSNNVNELLPFYVNGSLSDDETSAVEAALASEPTLATEVTALRLIRDEMQADDNIVSPGEFGLARLMRDIEKTPAPVRRGGLMSYLAVAAVAAFASVAVASLLTGPQNTAEYTLAGAGTDQSHILVGFAEGVSVADISAALATSGLEITGGPSALNLFTLGLQDEGDLSAALETLRASNAALFEYTDLIE